MDHILIVDDDPGIRRLLTRYLSEHGYLVTGAADGREMRRALDAAIPDLIILDLMLPGEDGLTLFRTLNADGIIPVIILTARDQAGDRVLGLEFGADDYVPKPFEPRELLARIKGVLRRVRRLPPSLEPESVQRYRFANWQLDVGARELVSPVGLVISLSGTEFRLLRALLNRPRQVIGRDHLAHLVWGKDVSPLDRGMDVLVSRLRQRLGDDARNPDLLKTIRYEGYKLDADVVTED